MLVLIENVFLDCLEMRRTYAEESVAILPVKVAEGGIQCFSKFGRVFFDNFQNFGRWKFLSEIAQDVNVVPNASDRNRVAFQVLENARLIRPDPLADARRQPWTTSLGRKNDVRG